MIDFPSYASQTSFIGSVGHHMLSINALALKNALSSAFLKTGVMFIIKIITIRPQSFKKWITLTTGQITIHWIVQLVPLTLIRWIVIYPAGC